LLTDAKCPFCVLSLQQRHDEAVCPNGHVFEAEGLSLATNMAAARHCGSPSMPWRTTRQGWHGARSGMPADGGAQALLAEAQAAREAAASLRALAGAAQRRLDGLAYPTTVVRLEEPPRQQADG
jgi:hypothetical protein